MASSYMSLAASGDNSKNGVPESISVMTRCRGRRLSRARCRSRARGGPPSAAVARRLSSSAISARMAAWLARNSPDLQSIFEAIADTDTSHPLNRYSETNFSTHEISHEDVWRNFACQWALGKSIAAGKGPSARVPAQTPNREGESLMRNKQQTLLAGVAALALFAASGIALAQQTQQDQKGAGGAAQSSMQSQRSQQGAKNQSANQGMRNQSAQQQNKHPNAMSRQSSGQNAQNESKMQSRQGNAGKMSNAGKGEKSFNRSAQEQKLNKGAGAT